MATTPVDTPVTSAECSVGEVEISSTKDTGNIQRPIHPNADRFWVSIKHWAEFSTFHGIRNVFDERTSLIRRACWLVIVIAFLITTVWICQDQLNRFFSYKTFTERISEHPHSIPFPAVTICSYNLVRNDSVKDQRERTVLSELYLKRQPNKTFLVEKFGATFLKNISLRRIFESSSESAEESFNECLWEGNTMNCNQWSKTVTPHGHCLTFNSLEDGVTSDMLRVSRMTGNRQGIHVSIWSNQSNYFIHEDASFGVKVIVHEPWEYPDTDNAIALAPGFTHYIALAKHKYVYLPYPVRAFGDQVCLGKYESSPDVQRQYTEQYCLHACRIQYVFAACGCVGPFDTDDIPECDPMQIIDCYNPTIAKFSYIALSCYCPIRCEVTEYTAKVSSARLVAVHSFNDDSTGPYTTRDSMLQLKVFYEKKVIHRHEQVLAVTFEDIWASFGGFLGITVGASIVTFLEVIEVFLVNAVYYFQSMRNIARGN